MNKKKKIYIGCFGTILLVFVLAIVIAVIADSSVKNKKEEASKNVEDTSLSIEKRVESAVISTVGEKNNMDDSRNIKVKKDGNVVKVTLLADESMSNKSSVSNMQNKATDILKSVQKIKELDNIAIIWQTNFVDKYGKKSLDDAMRIFIRKDELDKIDFNNFDFSNIPKVSYNYYLHPSFNK